MIIAAQRHQQSFFGFLPAQMVFLKGKGLSGIQNLNLSLPFISSEQYQISLKKRYALLLNHFQHFQQHRKGHGTFILRPISLRGWRKIYTEWNLKAWKRVSIGKHKTGPRKQTDPNPFFSCFLKENYFSVELAMVQGKFPLKIKEQLFKWNYIPLCVCSLKEKKNVICSICSDANNF